MNPKTILNLLIINILIYSSIGNNLCSAGSITKQKPHQRNLILQNPKKYLIISEIFPNPKGKDTNKEWLEIYNPGDTAINLKNWKITQSKINSPKAKIKATTIANELIIKSKSYLILDNSKIKSLANKQSKIELSDPDGRIIDSISYEKTKENLSLSKTMLIDIVNKKTYLKHIWTIPGKNKENPKFYQISGITKKIGKNNFVLKNKVSPSKFLKIFLTENSFKNITKDLLLKENQEILVLAEKNNKQLILRNYQIKNAKLANYDKQAKKITQIDQILIKIFQMIFFPALIIIIILIITKTKTTFMNH